MTGAVRVFISVVVVAVSAFSSVPTARLTLSAQHAHQFSDYRMRLVRVTRIASEGFYVADLQERAVIATPVVLIPSSGGLVSLGEGVCSTTNQGFRQQIAALPLKVNRVGLLIYCSYCHSGFLAGSE